MKIYNYLQFIKESKDKTLLPVVFSDEFKDKLDNIGNSHVASSFKQLYDSEVEKEYTLISVGDSEDTITYTDSHKLKDYSGDLIKIKSSDELWKKNRTEIKVGRFINKFFLFFSQKYEKKRILYAKIVFEKLVIKYYFNTTHFLV